MSHVLSPENAPAAEARSTPTLPVSPSAWPAAPQAVGASADYALIRGRQLDLSALVDPRLHDPAYRQQLRAELAAAQPFPHLVVEGWFNPMLLELINEEFETDRSDWKTYKDEHQLLHRSMTLDNQGPATRLYFSIVNAGWFLMMLAEITDIEDLLPDVRLFGGGLHETRVGGKFGMHRDFDKHALYGLDNRMVFITYLNKNWDPAWGAALELWDVKLDKSGRSVVPELGRSILMLHGPASFHGHPEPMKAPPGQPRRSVANYYYQNALAVPQRMKRVTSVFLLGYQSKRLRHVVKMVTPPILIDLVKKYVIR